MLPLENLMYLC
jgi:hypothetical protein